jgi:hypothetical protein
MSRPKDVLRAFPIEKAAELLQPPEYVELLLDNFQQFHGASLDTDATGDALGSRILGLHDHDLHGAGFHTLATLDAQLLVDHEHAGLGILSDGAMLTGTHALATLNTHHRLSTGSLGNHVNAAQIFIEFLVEGGGTSPDTFQTCHTFNALFCHKLLHIKGSPFHLLFPNYYTG